MTFEQMLAQAKQLYNGTQELQRVYNGETMVWNRYNWEKWSCNSETVTETKWELSLVGQSTMPSDFEPASTYRSYSINQQTGIITGQVSVSGTLQQMHDNGWFSVAQAYGNDTMVQYCSANMYEGNVLIPSPQNSRSTKTVTTLQQGHSAVHRRERQG